MFKLQISPRNSLSPLARAEFFRGLVAVCPLIIGVLPYALVLGAQAAQKGLNIAELPVMTGLNFAGGSEFAAIQLWTFPPHIVLIAAITFLINSRHILMGATLAPYLQHLPKRKVLPALFLMCDETWALGYADAQKRAESGMGATLSLPYFLGASVVMYSTWVIFTTLGAAIGPVIGDVDAYGFDMAFPAVFLVLIRGMWKGFRAASPWLVSLLVAAGTYLLEPGGAWYVASGALSGMIAAYIWGAKTNA